MKNLTQREQMAYSTIARLEAELAKAKSASSWIKCSSQMPSKNQSCIVYRCDMNGAVPANMYWDGQEWIPDGYGFEVDFKYGREDISHWQPLPAPPEPDQ